MRARAAWAHAGDCTGDSAGDGRITHHKRGLSRVIIRQILCTAALLTAWSTTGIAQSPEQWLRDGRAAVDAAKRLTHNNSKARNVILFIGDGMGITTITAARILEGQRSGKRGEENLLSFEKLPFTALIKTYNTDQQTPESPGTMSAIVTGVKTNSYALAVNQRVRRGDHVSVDSNRLTTIIELAERAGLSTGIVTTTTVTQ